MNPDTGEIKKFLNEQQAKREGFTVPLGKVQAAALLMYTPQQRLDMAKDIGLIPPSPGRGKKLIGGKVFKARKSASR